MREQEIAEMLARVNRGLIQGKYDYEGAYLLLREGLHNLLYVQCVRDKEAPGKEGGIENEIRGYEL